MPVNDYGQTIGDLVEDFSGGSIPKITELLGKTVKVEKLSDKHIVSLYEVYGPNSPKENWTYLPIERFESFTNYQEFIGEKIDSQDPYYLAIVDLKTNQALGTFALMRNDQVNGVIEMGWVIYSNQLQRTRMATEAQFLVMRYVFETMGYRRYEWKCDHLNRPSHQAARRLGFTYEGTFRQALINKGRNRDTDWFSLLDSEWKVNKLRLEKCLSDDNFTADGRQIVSLQDIHV